MPQSLEGRKLGDFEILKRVGAGGMGEVYKARQISLDRIVAVKVLPAGLADQEDFLERFQREAKSAANLIHPNVIQVYSIGVEDGLPYFAMEYVEGDDLNQRLRKGPIPYDEMVDILIGVASALGCAYEKDIIHRDIKPSNIMIDKAGEVKVMDFGLAKATQSDSNLTRSDIIMGTPNYISPEQGRGDKVDHRSDLYSLGVVMFEMITGQRPFSGDSPATVIYKHAYEAPPVPHQLREGIPPFLEEICLRLMAKEPDDRYPNAKALLQDLLELKTGLDYYVGGGDRRPGTGFQGAEDSTAPHRPAFRDQPTAGIGEEAIPRTREAAPVERSRAPLVLTLVLLLAVAGALGGIAGGIIPRPAWLPWPEGWPGGGPRGPGGPRGGGPVAGTHGHDGTSGGTVATGGEHGTAGSSGGTNGTVPPTNGGETVGTDGSRTGTQGTQGGTSTPEIATPPAPRPAHVLLSVLAANPEVQGHTLEAYLRGDGPERLVQLNDMDLDPGEKVLRLVRPGYRPCIISFRVTDGRVEPAVDLWEVSFEPTDVLVHSYTDGVAALQAGRWDEAIRRLEEVWRLDPAYRGVTEQLAVARQRFSEGQAATQRVEGRLQDARAAQANLDWRGSLATLRTLRSELPEGSPYLDQVALLEAGAENHIREGVRLIETARGLLSEGQFDRARLQVRDAQAADPGVLEALDFLAQVTQAEAHYQAAVHAFDLGDYPTAVTELQALLQMAPNHRDANDRLARARQTLQEQEARTRRVEETRTALAQALRESRFQDAMDLADACLRDADLAPLHADARSAREQAQRELLVQEIAALFGDLDAALAEGRPFDALALIDAGPAADRARSDLQSFFGEGIRLSASHHGEFEWTQVTPQDARVRCVWEFTIAYPGIGRATRGRLHQEVACRRVAGRWRFVSFQDVGSISVDRS